MGGLWSQFLPATGLLLAVWAYCSTFLPGGGDAGAFLFFLATFLTVPVFGLYFSLRCRNFITAFLATVAVGLLLPLVLPEALRALWPGAGARNSDCRLRLGICARPRERRSARASSPWSAGTGSIAGSRNGPFLWSGTADFSKTHRLMTFLPIVARELRVAARRPGTYWVRSGAALALILVWHLVFPDAPGRAAARDRPGLVLDI